MSKDVWSLVLLTAAFIGAIKGRNLPVIIPQILMGISFLLLLYRGFFVRSKYSVFYTASTWVSLAWIAGKSMEEAWGAGLMTLIPFYLFLGLTPVVAFIHQRIYRRLNPVATRGLELEPVEYPLGATVINRLKKLSKRKPESNDTQPAEIELITFDLGRKVKHTNR